MKRSIRDEWIRNLESGEIPQTANNLCADNARCCLGVLCDVLGMEQETDVSAWGCRGYYFPDEDGPLDTLLPVMFSERLGLESLVPDEMGSVGMNSIQNVLAGMNDTGSSFADIAAWIKENVPVEEDEQ